MIDLVLCILAIIAMIAGSFVDIKKREVPDWISYGLLFSALGARLIYSVFNLEYTPILSGVLGFAVFFVLANVMYYTKQWGGGDAKILMGLGAVLGFNISLILFIILWIFVGAAYGIIYSVFLALKNRKEFNSVFAKNMKKLKKWKLFVWIISVIIVLFSVIFGYLLYGSGLVLIILLGFYSFVFSYSVQESCLFQKVKVSKLTEGDWLDETIKINGKVVVPKNNPGLTLDQIKALKNYKKLVVVKLGLPFIPVFLMSFIALLVAKDWLYSLLMLL